jgi:hypothetical protein
MNAETYRKRAATWLARAAEAEDGSSNKQQCLEIASHYGKLAELLDASLRRSGGADPAR